MKAAIVIGLEVICGWLDLVPTWERDDDGRLKRFCGGWGCRLGVGVLSVELDERWNTGRWYAPTP